MTGGDDIQLVTFRVGGQDFAFNIFQVERILRYEAPSPLPKAPDFLEGVLRYHGAAVPLIDLRKRLGAPAPLKDDTRTVILEWDGAKIGTVVDTVTEVLQVAATDVTAPPGIVKGLAAEYITGLVVKEKRTIIVLNTNKLLMSKEKLQLDAALTEHATSAQGEDLMAESALAALRAQYDAIARRLEGTGAAAAEREAVKREIIAYFKQVDAMIGELTQLKEEVRQLVEKFKQLAASTAEAAAPEFTGSRPAVHADHIGASTFIEKGWSLISLGDHVGAIQALQRALQLSPGETQAESLLGWAQMLNGDYDDALQTFSKVLMKEPANSLARINVGYICLKKRIFGEAIEHLSKAIRLDNDKKATLYAHFYLGLVYLQREMYEDAQTFFGKTLKLGPNLIEAYYELGRARWFAGEQDQAKQTWTDGFKANKFNPWGKKCQEMLDLVAQGGEPPRT